MTRRGGGNRAPAAERATRKRRVIGWKTRWRAKAGQKGKLTWFRVVTSRTVPIKERKKLWKEKAGETEERAEPQVASAKRTGNRGI